RVLAHITGDPGLREAFANDEDVHAATAAKVWGFAVEDVPRDLRARAKAINFGLAYGMNRFGLAQRLGITPDEAQEYIDGYFRSFPMVKEFMAGVVKQAYADGFTSTLVGRRRYIPELEHSNPRVRALGERQALNAPIQGSAADIFKLAMVKVHNGLLEEGSKARMVLTVHDELLFEVPSSAQNETVDRVRSMMAQAADVVGVRERRRKRRLLKLAAILAGPIGFLWYRIADGRPFNPFAFPHVSGEAVYFLPMIIIFVFIAALMVIPFMAQGRS